MNLAYGEEKGIQVMVSLLDKQAGSGDNARFDGLLASRLDFDLQILEIPSVPEKEVAGLIRYRLRSIYPGSPAETAFDYRVESTGARQQAVVFIARASTLDRYRKAAGGKPLFLPYLLVQPIVRRRRDVRIWFCMHSWAELTVFRGGLLTTCSLVRREGAEAFDPRGAESELPEDVRALPCLVIAAGSDQVGRGGTGTSAHHGAMPFLSIRDLSASLRKTPGLFGVPGRKGARVAPSIRIAALTLLVAVLGVLVLYKNVWLAEAHLSRLKRTRATLQEQSERAIAVQAAVDSLRAETAKLNAEKPQDIYLLLSSLALVLGSDVRVRSLQVHDDSFQVDAVGANPLRLMEKFREYPLFETVKLSQVIPDQQLGRERFSFSGVFHGR
jgi:hypothetical protein